MANNRMWLIHKPSKLGIMLGKRMAVGWYRPPSEEDLGRFYEHLENNYGYEGQDDFILVNEDDEGWNYTGEYVEGFMVMTLDE